jgi:hypothetical protein
MGEVYRAHDTKLERFRETTLGPILEVPHEIQSADGAVVERGGVSGRRSCGIGADSYRHHFGPCC